MVRAAQNLPDTEAKVLNDDIAATVLGEGLPEFLRDLFRITLWYVVDHPRP